MSLDWLYFWCGDMNPEISITVMEVKYLSKISETKPTCMGLEEIWGMKIFLWIHFEGNESKVCFLNWRSVENKIKLRIDQWKENRWKCEVKKTSEKEICLDGEVGRIKGKKQEKNFAPDEWTLWAYKFENDSWKSRKLKFSLSCTATWNSTHLKSEMQISQVKKEFKILNAALQHRHEHYATVQRCNQWVWQVRKNKDMK